MERRNVLVQYSSRRKSDRKPGKGRVSRCLLLQQSSDVFSEFAGFGSQEAHSSVNKFIKKLRAVV